MASLEYVREETPVHRLHPFVKFTLLGSSLFTALIIDDIGTLLIWLTMLLCWWAIARIPVRRLSLIFKLLLGTTIFLIVLQGFMYAGGKTPLFTIGHFRLWGEKDYGVFTLEGLIWGITICFRVYCAVLALPVFTMTTPITEIAAALNKLKVPYVFSLLFTTSLKFVPLASKSWDNILLSQQLRGLDLKKMNILSRVRKVYTSAVSTLMLYLLRTASTLQVALESRAFGATVQRTFILERGLTKKELLLMALIVAFAVGLIVFRFTYGQIVPIGRIFPG